MDNKGILSMLQLQECDKQLIALDKKLKQSESAKEILKGKKHKIQIENSITTLKDELNKIDESTKALDLYLEKSFEQINQLKNKLYKEKKERKELISIEEKIHELQNNIKINEEKYYELLEKREKLQEKLANARKDYKDLKEKLLENINKFKIQQEVIEKERKQLLDEKNQLLSCVDKDLFKRYNQNQGEEQVVLVMDGNCGYCGVSVSFEQIKALKTMENTERCEYCGKYLFLVKSK